MLILYLELWTLINLAPENTELNLALRLVNLNDKVGTETAGPTMYMINLVSGNLELD